MTRKTHQVPDPEGYQTSRRAEIVAHRANQGPGSEAEPRNWGRSGFLVPKSRFQRPREQRRSRLLRGLRASSRLVGFFLFDGPGSNPRRAEASPRSWSCSAELEAPAIAGEAAAAAKPWEPEIRIAEWHQRQPLRTVRSNSAGGKPRRSVDGGPAWAQGMDRYQRSRFATRRFHDSMSAAIRATALPHQDIVQGLGQPLGGRGRRAPMFLEQTHHSPSGPRAR